MLKIRNDAKQLQIIIEDVNKYVKDELKTNLKKIYEKNEKMHSELKLIF